MIDIYGNGLLFAVAKFYLMRFGASSSAGLCIGYFMFDNNIESIPNIK